jgi:energy-coupling factor transporter ATP-binding protein EcfA2
VVKLKRLKIQRYRNVEPCELRFSDRFNVLLGPNGAGKTTLLNVIAKVLSTNLSDASDPISVEVELAFQGGTLSGIIEHVDPHKFTTQEMQVIGTTTSGIAQAARAPDFKLHLEQSHLGARIDIDRVQNGVRVVVDGAPHASMLPPEVAEVTGSLLGLLEFFVGLSVLGGASGIIKDLRNASRFDESLDVFRAIAARQDDVGLVCAELRPLVRYNKADGGVGGVFALADGMVPAAMIAIVQARVGDEVTRILFTSSDLRFLSETMRLVGLHSARAELELTGRSVRQEPKADVFDYGNLKFWFTRRDGSIFQDQHLSYGQKRLLAFLYYLDCNPSFVIADELVNGLHHAWIEECVAAIGDRQAFLTSQNPLLLDYLSFESVEQVKETFILCRTEPDGDRDKMIWRNMTDDEADMFYSAYKVGIEHVGEILRTRGLW